MPPANLSQAWRSGSGIRGGGVFTDLNSFFQGQSALSITYIEGSQIYCDEQLYGVCPDDGVSVHCAKFIFHLHWDTDEMLPFPDIQPHFSFSDFLGTLRSSGICEVLGDRMYRS